jgi:PAS domain S-box-containing protein
VLRTEVSRDADTAPLRANASGTMSDSEARLHALIEASPLGIVIMDLDGEPIFYNPKGAELHEIRDEKAGGRAWVEAIHPDDREQVVSSWYEAARARRPWSETYRVIHQDGEVIWVSGRAAPMVIDGRIAGFVGTLEDVTQRKRTESELEVRLAREQAARMDASKAIRARDRVLALVAHDLRNPLSAISMSASLLRDLPLAEGPRAQHLDMIQRAATGMDHLIEDLLDVSRMEAGRLAIKRSRVDVSELLFEMRDLFEPQARPQRISLECVIGQGLPPLIGDRDRLVQALSNLVGNALKFTPEGGRVVLSAHPRGGEVEISVADTGQGIAAEDLPRIFDRFWQVERASRAGAGLGLEIVKGIVEAHGGRVRVESVAGRGTTFHLFLPSSAG